MKCLLNPVSGEIKRVSDHEARKLLPYGWTYTSKAAWKAYKAKELTQAIRRRA